MQKKTRTLIPRTLLTMATVIACSSALAMPFCGNKGGYKSGYRYMPAYAYQPMMPAYGHAPMAQSHVHSWNRAIQPMAPGVASQAAPATTQPPAPAGR